MDDYSYELRIPKARIAVLIGKDGEIKKSIEEETKTKLDIDSKEGDVFISGEDALGMYTCREIIRAIGRGFNPEIAQLLLHQDNVFEMINLQDWGTKDKNSFERLKGRIIGREGKSRKIMEDLTEAYVCVYGKTVSILGQPDNVAAARHAIEMLLKGSPHSSVYKWMEKRRRDLKRERQKDF